MNTKLATLIAIMCITAFTSNAQVQGLKPMEKPIKYVNPVENVPLSQDTENTRIGSYWVVYSDRDNNQTYTKPNGNEMKEIDFMESFIVAEENDDWIHIVKDLKLGSRSTEDIYSLEENKFFPDAEDYGWVKKGNMLLWDRSLVTAIGKINLKGMILNTIQSLKKESLQRNQSKDINVYMDPELEKESGKSSKVYEILYVYKVYEDKNALLLGTLPRFATNEASQIMKGWVKMDNVTMWDHRIAFEANWDKPAANERIEANSASLFLSPNEAIKYQNGEKVNESSRVWSHDTYAERPIGDLMRFPLLDNLNNGIYKVGSMGALRNESTGKVAMEGIDWAQIRRTYNEMRENERKINVIFVVDRTLSMSPYFKAVSGALDRTMTTLINTSAGQTFMFGGVAYTDSWEEDKLVETKRLGSYQEISNWFKTMDSYHNKDKDTPEAVYYGLMSGIRATGIQPNQTNVIILIGDAGDHQRPNDMSNVPQDQLVRSIVDYRCNITAIQVHYGSHSSYLDFRNQMKDVIFEASNQLHNYNSSLAENLKFNYPTPTWIPVTSNKEVIDTISTVIMGSIMYCDENRREISPEEVQQQIEETVRTSYAISQRRLNRLSDIVELGEGAFLPDSKNRSTNNEQENSDENYFDAAMLDFLRRSGISNDKLSVILDENYQLYHPAYATLSVKGQQYPLFNMVLFITQQKIGEMLSLYDRLIDASTATESREMMQSLYVKLLNDHLGEKTNPDALLEYTFEDINEMVWGLPGRSKLLKYRLRDLTNESIISNEALYEIILEIRNKRTELSKIFNENYKYSFMSLDQRYYWLPQDLLP